MNHDLVRTWQSFRAPAATFAPSLDYRTLAKSWRELCKTTVDAQGHHHDDIGRFESKEGGGGASYGAEPPKKKLADRPWAELAHSEKLDRMAQIIDELGGIAKNPQVEESSRVRAQHNLDVIESLRGDQPKLLSALGSFHEIRRQQAQPKELEKPGVPGRGADDVFGAAQAEQQRKEEAKVIQGQFQQQRQEATPEERKFVERELKRFKREESEKKFRDEFFGRTEPTEHRKKTLLGSLANAAGSLARATYGIYAVASRTIGAVGAGSKGDYIELARHLTHIRNDLRLVREQMGDLSEGGADIMENAMPHIRAGITMARIIHSRGFVQAGRTYRRARGLLYPRRTKTAKRLAKEWEEAKHPRGEGGRWTSAPGGGGADAAVETKTRLQHTIEQAREKWGSIRPVLAEAAKVVGGIALNVAMWYAFSWGLGVTVSVAMRTAAMRRVMGAMGGGAAGAGRRDYDAWARRTGRHTSEEWGRDWEKHWEEYQRAKASARASRMAPPSRAKTVESAAETALRQSHGIKAANIMARYLRPGSPGEKASALAALKRMGIDPTKLGKRAATPHWNALDHLLTESEAEKIMKALLATLPADKLEALLRHLRQQYPQARKAA